MGFRNFLELIPNFKFFPKLQFAELRLFGLLKLERS